MKRNKACPQKPESSVCGQIMDSVRLMIPMAMWFMQAGRCRRMNCRSGYCRTIPWCRRSALWMERWWKLSCIPAIKVCGRRFVSFRFCPVCGADKGRSRGDCGFCHRCLHECGSERDSDCSQWKGNQSTYAAGDALWKTGGNTCG